MGWGDLLWTEAECFDELAFLAWCERTGMDVVVNVWMWQACHSGSAL